MFSDQYPVRPFVLFGMILFCFVLFFDRISFTHLVLVFSLDEEGKGESHLGQLRDADPVLGTVKLWGVVIPVD